MTQQSQAPTGIHYEEAGFVEFINSDVPYIVREIDGQVAILLDVATRNVIGYRVYDPGSALGGTQAKQGEADKIVMAAFQETRANTHLSNPTMSHLYEVLCRRIDAALFQHPVAAAVKPLEWETTGDNDADDIAETICGQFWVADTNIGYRLYFIYEADGSIYQSVLGTQLGREAAKAAAQSHYETTIRSALYASPVPAKADGGVTETTPLKAALRAYAVASQGVRCPICNGVEGCDDTVRERLCADLALQQDQRS